MTEIVESSVIPGIKLVRFRVFADSRGQFMETFRKEWFPERVWDQIQGNRSESVSGVLRGLHFHHRQVDFWQVLHGTIRVGLADLRRSSPTFGAVETLELTADQPSGLFIPSGVAHGFLALTQATLLYLVDQYYDGSDERGIAWNDPDLNLAWGIQAPMLSERDRLNPLLRALPNESLPL